MMVLSVGRNMWLSHNTTAVLKGRVGFFQSVRICGLGYNPNDQETGLISGMGKSVLSFTNTPDCGALTASCTVATVVVSPITAKGACS